jgi:trans-aconitate methyltransferase
MRIFGDATDEVWKAYGRDDPYFGVLAHDEYTRKNLSAAQLEKFFISGEREVAKLMSSIDQVGLELRRETALDFGCGVGRLVIPLASRFKEVVGVDLSDGMLAEAEKNVKDKQLKNVAFFKELPDLHFDLLHSALVFQHINPTRGMKILLDCWSRLAPSGLLAV